MYNEAHFILIGLKDWISITFGLGCDYKGRGSLKTSHLLLARLVEK